MQDKKDSSVINDFLIATLKDEITFLRKEISSKDKIIELIFNKIPKDNAKYLRVDDENRFNPYNKTFTPLKESSLINVVPIANKYTPLNHINSCDVKSQDDVTDKINCITENPDSKKADKSSKLKKRSINIIGDSILKDVKSYYLKNKLRKTDKLYVQSYRGARTSAMKHHAKASLEFSPDVYVVHCGTNDLK